VDSTRIRRVDTTAILLGLPGKVFDEVTASFQSCGVNVVRVGNVAAALERLPHAMPQVVVVLGALKDAERGELADRATAVGALVVHVDPELDEETLQELVQRTVRAALERKLRRDAGNEDGEPPPEGGEDVDDNW
jgi:hypothetical protein